MNDRAQYLKDQIAAMQEELSDLERYRYRTIMDSKGRRIELRDDGYRISFRLPDTRATNVDPDEWIMWAEYKQCDLPGPGGEIADALMAPISRT